MEICTSKKVTNRHPEIAKKRLDLHKKNRQKSLRIFAQNQQKNSQKIGKKPSDLPKNRPSKLPEIGKFRRPDSTL